MFANIRAEIDKLETALGITRLVVELQLETKRLASKIGLDVAPIIPAGIDALAGAASTVETAIPSTTTPAPQTSLADTPSTALDPVAAIAAETAVAAQTGTGDDTH